MIRLRRLGVAIAIGVVMLGGLWGYARFVEPRRLTIEEYDVPVAGLSPGLDGMTVAFLADLQVDDPGQLEARLVEAVAELDPDLIVIGGDFANVPYWMVDYLRHAASACSVIARMPARIGKFGVWGNNDLPEGIGPLAEAAGVRVLENEWVTLSLPGGDLTLVGLDDPVTDRHDWDALFATPPPSPHLFIAHSPDAFAEATRRGMKVILTGHTHGGQVRHPFLALAPRRFLRLKPDTPPYRAGWYDDPDGGDARLYVSRGIGTSRVHMRFLCPPELTVLRLRAAPSEPWPARS